MYNEIYTKCESMIDELMKVKADCLIDNTRIKDVKHGNLLNDVNRSMNALNGVMDTIRAFFEE